MPLYALSAIICVQRSTAEMICSGILPINQMRDYIGPGAVIASRVPLHLLEAGVASNCLPSCSHHALSSVSVCIYISLSPLLALSHI